MSLMVPFIIPLYGSVTAFPSLDRYSARPPACFPIAIPEDIPKNKQRKRIEKKKEEEEEEKVTERREVLRMKRFKRRWNKKNEMTKRKKKAMGQKCEDEH